VEANSENRDKAETFVRALKPTGGTAINDALQKALSLVSEKGAAERMPVIVFLTDGQPTIGVTDENTILANARKQMKGHVRIFCFGIGTDVNTHLLDKLTEDGKGASQYVLPEEDLEVKVSNFFAKIREPVLTDLSLKFTGDVRATKTYPAPLPDLFKGEQLLVVGRYSGKGSSAVILEGTIEGNPKRYTYEVNFGEKSDENSFIPRLWATGEWDICWMKFDYVGTVRNCVMKSPTWPENTAS
jgi:Ca-activated chloride channel family protein